RGRLDGSDATVRVMAFVGALLGIAVTWAAVAAGLIGLGSLVRKTIRVGLDPRPQGGECFWTGCTVLLLILQAWHFARAIDWRAALAVGALGCLGLLTGWKELTRWLAETVARSRAATAISIVACVWLADRAAGPTGAWDSGVYHIPAVEWFTAHALVPGLGNLEGRLAFNNSSLLYTAFLEVGPWRHRSEHVANGLLLAALTVQVLFACARLARGNRWSAADVFLAVLLLPCVYMATDPTILNVASPTTDGAAIILTLVSAAWCLSLAGSEAEGSMFRALAAALLMAAAVTIKLSTIGYAAVGWVWLAAWWAKRRNAVGDGEAGRAGAAARSPA